LSPNCFIYQPQMDGDDRFSFPNFNLKFQTK
jgi:hypothetical protein